MIFKRFKALLSLRGSDESVDQRGICSLYHHLFCILIDRLICGRGCWHAVTHLSKQESPIHLLDVQPARVARGALICMVRGALIEDIGIGARHKGFAYKLSIWTIVAP